MTRCLRDTWDLEDQDETEEGPCGDTGTVLGDDLEKPSSMSSGRNKHSCETRTGRYEEGTFTDSTELLDVRKNMVMVIEDSEEELGARVEEILQKVEQTVEDKKKV